MWSSVKCGALEGILMLTLEHDDKFTRININNRIWPKNIFTIYYFGHLVIIYSVVWFQSNVQKLDPNSGNLLVGLSLVRFPKFYYHKFSSSRVFHWKGASQTSANNSTPPRYSKNIWYSAIIRGRIGQIVAQYFTRPRVGYLYFRPIWQILVESNRTWVFDSILY